MPVTAPEDTEDTEQVANVAPDTELLTVNVSPTAYPEPPALTAIADIPDGNVVKVVPLNAK